MTSPNLTRPDGSRPEDFNISRRGIASLLFAGYAAAAVSADAAPISTDAAGLVVEDLAVLDGYVPSVERAGNTPQVQRRLLMRIDSILDFRCGPHSDSPIHVHDGH